MRADRGKRVRENGQMVGMRWAESRDGGQRVEKRWAVGREGGMRAEEGDRK